jgi:hypothetical protein
LATIARHGADSAHEGVVLAIRVRRPWDNPKSKNQASHVIQILKLEAHAVIGQFYAGRKLLVDGFMVNVVRHVRQKRFLRLHASNDLKRFINAEMGGMPPEAQGIQHQHVQPVQQWPAAFGNFVHIGAISDISKPKTQHIEMGVKQGYRRDGLAQDFKGRFGNAVDGELRDVNVSRFLARGWKCVGEDGPNYSFNFGGAVKRHWSAQLVRDRADVIQAEEVVCMVVSE